MRQASEQYFTASQFFAQAFRHVISRPQAAQGLLGRKLLLPRKELDFTCKRIAFFALRLLEFARFTLSLNYTESTWPLKNQPKKQLKK